MSGKKIKVDISVWNYSKLALKTSQRLRPPATTYIYEKSYFYFTTSNCIANIEAWCGRSS